MGSAARLVVGVCVALGIAIVVGRSSRSALPRPRSGESIIEAEPPIDGFVARSITIGGDVMAYRLFQPEGYDRTKSYPLVVWLHGAGGIGDDNHAQIEGDQVPGTHTWTDGRVQADHPAFVLVPQSDNAWDPYADVAELPSVQRVAKIIEGVRREFRIDAGRTYLLGQSLGGRAALNLAMNRPELFAAVVVLCPAPIALDRVDRLRQTPVWLFQGNQDSEGFVSGSRALIQRLKSGGGSPRYTEYDGLGHEIWTRVFAEPDLVSWVFAQRR